MTDSEENSYLDLSSERDNKETPFGVIVILICKACEISHLKYKNPFHCGQSKARHCTIPSSNSVGHTVSSKESQPVENKSHWHNRKQNSLITQ